MCIEKIKLILRKEKLVMDINIKVKDAALYTSSIPICLQEKNFNDRELFMKGIDYSYYYEEE